MFADRSFMVRRHIEAGVLYLYRGLQSEKNKVQMYITTDVRPFNYSHDEILQNTALKYIVGAYLIIVHCYSDTYFKSFFRELGVL